jgi:urea carboxylase
VATPIDPRHRLVTTKYNPARTWTPENAVGIGGAYLCVYGMEGPGGYQFVGRTVQMWNTWNTTRDFPAGKPWLLDFFDQIRFYPVSAAELLELREAFPHGRFHLNVEPGSFSLEDHNRFLARTQASAAEFKARQHQSFVEERERWALTPYVEPPEAAIPTTMEGAAPEGCRPVSSPVTASVWSLAVEPGERVRKGQRLLILEAMKMEVAVSAPAAGVVETLLCSTGSIVQSGQRLLYLRVEN